MLKAIGITKKVRGRAILNEVSFELPQGAIASMLGPSGSGKTTLLRVIMGLESTDAGDLYFADRCLTSPGLTVSPEDRGITLVFQEFTLLPHLNVWDNLAFSLKRPASEKTRINKLLDMLEITHLQKRSINKLSGGEQQRVALARALVMRPGALLLDEPFSNIDNMMRERLYPRLLAEIKSEGMTTLIATHDHKEAFYFGDSILVMNEGRLIDQNSPRLIYQEPKNSWIANFFGATNIMTGEQVNTVFKVNGLDHQHFYLIRPEVIEIVSAQNASAFGSVSHQVYYGSHQEVELSLNRELNLRVRCSGSLEFRPGQKIGVRLQENVSPRKLEEHSE